MNHPLFKALALLGSSIWELLGALLTLLLPWTPLAAWVIFWMFAVNWLKLRGTLAKGGWVGLALMGAIMILVWGNISPGTGTVDFFGLRVSNFVEKTVYVSGLFVILFMAGALQLSGCCSACCRFDEPEQIAVHSHNVHSHNGHSHNGGAHGPDAAHGSHAGPGFNEGQGHSGGQH